MTKTNEFERRVAFEPGYNYLHETGPKRRGQTGMRIRFSLIGDQGAAQFLMSTMWTPLGEVDANVRIKEPVHCDHGDSFGGLIRPPSGSCVGLHSRKPFAYETEAAPGKCDLWNGDCYYDASFCASDDVLLDFIQEGDEAVWRHLAEWYERLGA